MSLGLRVQVFLNVLFRTQDEEVLTSYISQL